MSDLSVTCESCTTELLPRDNKIEIITTDHNSDAIVTSVVLCGRACMIDYFDGRA
jgi:hypothetical protein